MSEQQQERQQEQPEETPAVVVHAGLASATGSVPEPEDED